MSDSRKDYEERMLRVMQRVHESEKQASAARAYNIHPSTLSRRLQGVQLQPEGAKHLQRLTPQQEKLVVDWIFLEEECGRAPSRQYVAAFASSILEVEEDTRPLGETWVDSFILRHPAVHTKIGRAVVASRLRTTKMERVEEFYALLGNLREKYKITPSNEFNMDETGVQESETISGTVLVSSKDRRTRIERSEATTWVTFIEYICLNRSFGPPVCIFSGVNVQAQ
jgi:hypothetical protein